MRVYSRILIVFMIVFLAGCAGSDGDMAQSDEVAKPVPAGTPEAPAGEEEGGEDEAPVPPAESISYNLSIKNDNVVIKKSYLGTRLLMMPTLIAQASPNTMSEVYGTKIVYFERKGASVYLMEDMEGKTITDPYEPVRIIAQFPIVEDGDEAIAFDFRSGLNNLIVTWGDYAGEDMPDMAVPVTASYIEEFATDDKMFSVNHIAQLVMQGQAFSVTFNYAFVPDESEIEALLPDELRRYGYFLTRPSYERTTGEEKHFVNRWDIAKPITFFISSNTPPEYFDSVKEGILAWNKAFGSDVVRAEAAPQGVVSGDPRYSIVQWVGFDDAGFAYANWHAHPRTGEILNAYAIITSTFAVHGREYAKRLLERLVSDNAAKKSSGRIGLAGFENTGIVDNEFYRPLTKFLSLAASGEMSDDDIVRLSKFLVRQVVMHEVGHDLGLRHNFFGNIGSEISPNDDRRPLMDVIGGSDPSGPLPSSSIMDYLRFEDDILMHSPGKYDIRAIRWAYGLGDSAEAPPLYCTDEEVGLNVDCERHDGGADPVIWRGNRMEDYASALSNAIEKMYFQGKSVGIPGDVELMIYFDGLLAYLDDSRRVLDIAGRTAEARRADAAGILAKYLKASDENYNSLTILIGEDLLKKISAENGEKNSQVYDYVSSIRYSYVTRVLDRLVLPVSAMQSSDAEGGAGGVRSITEVPDAQRRIAEAAATIAANHTSVKDASEPAELRFKAASVFSVLNREIVHDIVSTAEQRIQKNIDALKDALSRATSDEEKREIQSSIEEEEAIQKMLRS